MGHFDFDSDLRFKENYQVDVVGMIMIDLDNFISSTLSMSRPSRKIINIPFQSHEILL